MWNSHVDLGLWADAMLVAPATASTIGKMANGIADNMLVTTYLSCKAPVFVAPAMDLDMFAHPSTRQNLDRLRLFGNRIIEPAEGELASHLVGKGRMEEPDKIVAVLENFFASQTRLEKKKIVITAGPTYEKIDPVRFIGNYSSGKMGFALAEACAEQGAEVTLIAGPVSLTVVHPNIKRIDVESAEEMYQAAITAFPEADAGILCAAVADYRPDHPVDEKVKKKDGDATLTMERTEDILSYLGAHKKPGQFLCGFSMETEHMLENSRAKLAKKNADMIVANNLKVAGAGFGTDTNVVTLITADDCRELEIMSKADVASAIVSEILKKMC